MVQDGPRYAASLTAQTDPSVHTAQTDPSASDVTGEAVICFYCSGKGSTICSFCGGSGVSHYDNTWTVYPYRSYQSTPVMCSVCGGSGWARCLVCNGAGIRLSK